MCEKLFAIMGFRRESSDPLSCSYKARVDYARYNIIANYARHVIKYRTSASRSRTPRSSRTR
eukprot:3021491-Heterocapsa_arctica.AAC.1